MVARLMRGQVRAARYLKEVKRRGQLARLPDRKDPFERTVEAHRGPLHAEWLAYYSRYPSDAADDDLLKAHKQRMRKLDWHEEEAVKSRKRRDAELRKAVDAALRNALAAQHRG